jgi:hypothetical protein
LSQKDRKIVVISVAEPHHFYVAPASVPGKDFDAATAPAPILLQYTGTGKANKTFLTEKVTYR